MNRPALRQSRSLQALTPIEVAAGLRHLPGMVFFDTAGNVPSTYGNPVSIIAADPRELIKGSIQRDEDRGRLREVLERNADEPMADRGFPSGGLCGWIDYEGDFVFGDYPEMLVHTHDGGWYEVGELSRQIRDDLPVDDFEIGEVVAD